MINHQENINPDEVDKFNRLAQDWWDSDGPLRTLHDINPARLNYITGKVALEGKRVLDAGCGGGVLTEALARRGALVQGLDASDAVVRIARQHARDNSLEIEYSAGQLEEFAAQNPDCFDVLTCMELLEHVPDPGELLQTCARLLRPGGDLILSTINRNLKSYLSTIIGAERVFGLLPEGTHDYGAFIRPSELDRWLRKAHFNVMDIRGMVYIPGIRYCALTNDPGVNYLVHARLGA